MLSLFEVNIIATLSKSTIGEIAGLLLCKDRFNVNDLLSTGQVIDPAKNSGLPDKLNAKTDVIAYTSNQVIWNDYEFSIDNLPTFRNFSIKLVGSGTNQAQPPRMKNLRVLALA